MDLVATSDHNVQYGKHAEFARYSLPLNEPARWNISAQWVISCAEDVFLPLNRNVMSECAYRQHRFLRSEYCFKCVWLKLPQVSLHVQQLIDRLTWFQWKYVERIFVSTWSLFWAPMWATPLLGRECSSSSGRNSTLATCVLCFEDLCLVSARYYDPWVGTYWIPCRRFRTKIVDDSPTSSPGEIGNLNMKYFPSQAPRFVILKYKTKFLFLIL